MNAVKDIIDLTDDSWILDNGAAMTLPGDIYTSLSNAKEIPYFMTEEGAERSRFVGRKRWTMTRQFRCPADKDLTCARLILEQVDCMADISVNGEKVKSIDDLFIRWVIPVGKYLVHGKNTIEITFIPMNEDPEKARYARTMAISSGSLSCINLPMFGIYGNVYIDLSDFFIEGVRTAILKKEGEWVVNLNIGVNSIYGGYIASDRCRVKFLRKNYMLPGNGTVLNKGSNSLKFCLKIPDNSVKTWNPAGFGEAHLYELIVCIDGALSFRTKIGFRDVKLPEKPRGALLINNNKVKIKGVAVLPESLATNSYHEILTLLNVRKILDLGFNAVLISRFGRYDNDFFYEAFDEAGILVFHEFMIDDIDRFSSKKLIDRLMDEVKYQTCRLSSHPSLILWKLPDSGLSAPGASIESYLRKNDGTHYISREAMDRLFTEIDLLPSWSSYETLQLYKETNKIAYLEEERKAIALSHLVQAVDFLDKYNGESYMLSFLNEMTPGYHKALSDINGVNKPIANKIRRLNFSNHIFLQENEEQNDIIISFGAVLRNKTADGMMRVKVCVRDFNGNAIFEYTLILKNEEMKDDVRLSELLSKIKVPWFVIASGNAGSDVLVPRKFRSVIPCSGIRINSAVLKDDGNVILELENDRPAFSVLLYSSFPGEFEINLFDMPERQKYVQFKIHMDVLFSQGTGCEKLLNSDLLLSAFSVWDEFSLRH